MNIESRPILSAKAAVVFQAMTENLQYHRLLDCLENERTPFKELL
jgi:hypothetical protein